MNESIVSVGPHTQPTTSKQRQRYVIHFPFTISKHVKWVLQSCRLHTQYRHARGNRIKYFRFFKVRAHS